MFIVYSDRSITKYPGVKLINNNRKSSLKMSPTRVGGRNAQQQHVTAAVTTCLTHLVNQSIAVVFL